MNDPQSTPQPAFDLGATFVVLTLRLWLGGRAILSGVEKYAGTTTSTSPVTIDGAVNSYGLTDATSVKFYSFANNKTRKC